MFLIRAFLIFIFPVSFAASSTDLLILKGGQLQKTISLENIKKTLRVDSISAYEPLEKRQKVYTGVPLIPLLESVYGKENLKKFDTVVFHCMDGYRTDIALSKFSQIKALLAFAEKDQKSFSLREPQTQKEIQLGPYYLIWERQGVHSLNDKNFPWPYGIHKIELLQNSIAYAAIKYAGASEKIIQGSQEFMNHCYSCHQLNGVGGQRGPPLNLFIASKQRSELVKFILDPQSFNPNSQMSGLPKNLPGRVEKAEAIIDYLKVMQRAEL
jgi:mono/diheme cytochrome c family protein